MPIKLNSSGGGSVTLDVPSTASATTLTVPASTGTVAMNPIPSATLGTASAGLFEYNGKSLYFTPQSTQRGVVPGMQFFALQSVNIGNNATGNQSFFGLSNGVQLQSSTVYAFEMLIVMTKTAGTTGHTISTLFGGTATLNSILYDVRVNDVPNGLNTYGASANQQGVTSNQASATVTTGTLTTASSYWSAAIKGIVSVNSGGTFNPLYALSAAPGGAYTVQPNSYMLIYPLAASGSNVNVGVWS